MLLDTRKMKAQAASLGEAVTFHGRDAESFLREIEHGPSRERQRELRAAVTTAAEVETDRSVASLLH